MDELDLTDAEKKATYGEIKEYVPEHTGLKVSSLYIAQVKQNCRNAVSSSESITANRSPRMQNSLSVRLRKKMQLKRYWNTLA